jgi:hypothetical protein
MKLLHHDIVIKMSSLDDYSTADCAYLG